MTADTTATGGAAIDQVRAFVGHHLGLRAGDDPLADDEELFRTGRASSLFAVQVVMWVQQTFDVAVTGEDMDISRFRSIAAIAEFVEAKQAAAGPG